MWLSRAVAWLVCVSLTLPSAAVPAEGVVAASLCRKRLLCGVQERAWRFVVRQGTVSCNRARGKLRRSRMRRLGTLWLAPGEANTVLDEVVAYRYAALRDDPNTHEKAARGS